MTTVHALIITILYLVDLLIFVPKYTKCKYDHTKRTTKLIWKGICIGIPLVVLIFVTTLRAFMGIAYLSNWLLVGAMTLCAVGDIVLEIRFVRGGVLFFAGHILYVTTLILLNTDFSYIGLFIYAVLVALGTTLTFKKLGRKYRIYLIGYNAAISGSFALSIPLILSFEPCLMLLGCGACFLAISDWILARNKSYGSTYGWSLISLVFYFGGQILISTYPFLQP